MGLFVYAPYGMPLDHPDLEPIWAGGRGRPAVVLHTFTVMPPYAPGGQDNWDNLFLQRSASHPWCGMRNMASLIGSGVMDRYPKLRIGTLEAGHGWLPFWMMRIDEHAETIEAALRSSSTSPANTCSRGRYFQSIEMPEGASSPTPYATCSARTPDVRLRLSARREPLPEVGGNRHGLGHAGSAQAQAVLGQRGAALRALRVELS